MNFTQRKGMSLQRCRKGPNKNFLVHGGGKGRKLDCLIPVIPQLESTAQLYTRSKLAASKASIDFPLRLCRQLV